MTYLFYLLLLIVPLITYNKSIDSFGIKTLLVMIFGFICLLDYRQPRKYYRPDVAYVFFGWVAISYLLCPWKLGNPGIEMLLLIAYLGIYVYARDHIFTAKVVPVLLISLALTIGYNFYLTGIHFARLEVGPSFINANIYSGWLVLVLPVAFAWGLHGKWIKWVFGGLIFGFGLIALWMTGCRSSMLGLAAGLAAFSAFYWGKRGLAIEVLIIGLFGAIALTSFAHQVIDPSRAHFWSGVIPQMQAHPIIGTGVGSFRTAYPLFKENIKEGAIPMHLLENVHNEFLQIITETGIIGLCLFLWLIYKIFKRADKSNILNIALIAGVFGCLVDNFWNVSLRYSAVRMIFWIYLALLASDTKAEKKESKGWWNNMTDYFYNR